MSWFGLFTYNGSTSKEGIVLTHIFGKKLIPWDTIVSASTNFHNQDIWVYRIVTTKDYFVVRPISDNFENTLIRQANLKPYQVHKWDPQHKKRWQKAGQVYKHAGTLDRIDDINYRPSS
jgi:hypothetical protein